MLVETKTPRRMSRAGQAKPALRLTKDAIRRKCLERIKSARKEAIWKRRLGTQEAREVLAQVLATEDCTMGDAEQWAEDEAWLLSPDDEAELMADIQAELRAIEEDGFADTYAEQLEAEARSVEDALESYCENDDDRLVCPVCSRGWMARRVGPFRRSIQCDSCGTQLGDDAADGLSIRCADCGFHSVLM